MKPWTVACALLVLTACGAADTSPPSDPHGNNRPDPVMREPPARNDSYSPAREPTRSSQKR
jgi:hypothetical protein